MRTFLLGVSVMCMCVVGFAQQTAKSLTTSNNLFIGFYEFKPPGYSSNPTKKYPLIIFLHGTGERGNGTTELSRVSANGIPLNIKNGSTMTYTYKGVTEGFLVLCPQLSTAYPGWINEYVDAMLSYAKQNLQVDTDRIFLTGLSLGGGGTWDYVTSVPGNASKFAGIVPVCPSGYQPGGVCYVANETLPVWGFHALDDGTCSVQNTQNAIAGVNGCNPTVAPLVKYYPSGGHAIWGRVYEESHNYQNPNIYEWMMMLGRRAAAKPNTPPVANAGADVTLTMPVNSVKLSAAASTDAEAPVAMYNWKKIAGPDNYIIDTAFTPTPTIKSMITGTYQFELTVTDFRGAVSKDTINILVNPGLGPNVPPVASAGPDISLNTASVYLNGTYSWDPDGTVVAYQWIQVSGPTTLIWDSKVTPYPDISNMSGGSYQIAITAIDNLGAPNTKGLNITNTQAVLPVEYVYVKGKRINDKNTITWATATEQNTDRFDVERSEDGKVFFVIGKVAAAGNSTSQKNYSFTDEKSPSTKVLYRLKQVDKDLKFKISKVVVLTASEEKGATVSFFPNPVQKTLTVAVNNTEKGKGAVTVYGLEGRQLFQEQFSKDQDNFSTSIDMEKVRPGVYMVEIKVGDNFKSIQRVVKQ